MNNSETESKETASKPTPDGEGLAEAAGSVDLQKLQTAIELQLEQIEKILGPSYKLTLIAKYHGNLPLTDADLLLSMEEGRESIMTVVDRFLPPNDKLSDSAGENS